MNLNSAIPRQLTHVCNMENVILSNIFASISDVNMLKSFFFLVVVEKKLEKYSYHKTCIL